MGIETEPGLGPEQEKTKRKRVPSAARKRQIDQVRDQLHNVGKVLPACPTNRDELVAMWNIAPDDAWGITIKVQGAKMGSTEIMLMDEIPLMEFNIESIARNFGPGQYYLRPAAGKYAAKSAKLPVSEPLARKYGWGRAPVTAADLAAERTVMKAVEGPTDPVDFMAAVQRVAERTVEETLARMGVGRPMAAAPAQTGTMTDQLTQFREMLGVVRGLEEDAIRTVERRMGVSKPEPEDGEGGEMGMWASIIKMALPVVAALVNRNPAVPQPPAPTPRPQELPYTAPAGPGETPAAAGQTTEQSMETHPSLPPLTPQEQQIVAPVAGLLRPFAAQLIAAGNSPANDLQVATELVGYMPPTMYESIVALNGLVTIKGPAVMGYIHTDLATERWQRILHALASELQKDEQE